MSEWKSCQLCNWPLGSSSRNIAVKDWTSIPSPSNTHHLILHTHVNDFFWFIDKAYTSQTSNDVISISDIQNWQAVVYHHRVRFLPLRMGLARSLLFRVPKRVRPTVSSKSYLYSWSSATDLILCLRNAVLWLHCFCHHSQKCLWDQMSASISEVSSWMKANQLQQTHA